MSQIKDLILYGKKYIVSSQVEALLCNLLNINSFELLNSKDKIVNSEIEKKFIDSVNKIYSTKKLSSAISQINFCDLKFKITDQVLLPHFETQEVVKESMKYIDKLFKGKGNLIDLGCGSGVIGLTIKYNFKNLNVDLIDISDYALCVAEENAKNLNLDVNIYKSDMLANVKNKYDIIISNPPYESDNYIPTLNNEPTISLYAKNNGLYYYEDILRNAHKVLKEKYMIIFEIGDYQKNDVLSLINKYLKNIEIKTLESKKGFEKSIYVFGGFNLEELNNI